MQSVNATFVTYRQLSQYIEGGEDGPVTFAANAAVGVDSSHLESSLFIFFLYVFFRCSFDVRLAQHLSRESPPSPLHLARSDPPEPGQQVADGLVVNLEELRRQRERPPLHLELLGRPEDLVHLRGTWGGVPNRWD